MSQASIHRYLSLLQRQIADTAARIKHKQPMLDKADGGREIEDLFAWGLRVENQAYEPVGSEAIYALLGQVEPADCGYAAGSYDTASRIDKKTTVAEGLVFENNKEFDFRV